MVLWTRPHFFELRADDGQTRNKTKCYQSIHLDLSQTYGSFGFAAGAGENGGAAVFFGGGEVVAGGSAGIAGACSTGLGATSGLFRSMNAGCFALFFASAKRTGTTRFGPNGSRVTQLED
jgi:hypothetical protein